MPIKHKKTSTVPSVGMPPGWVKPDDWNDEHDMSAALASMDQLALVANRGVYIDTNSQFATFILSAYMRTILAMGSNGELFSALGAAPIDSPAFTGHPTGVTETGTDNSTRLATTAFVKNAITALIAGSPGLLDTLDELAQALNDDPNFATTMTNALALKAPLASPAFTGSPTAPNQTAGDNSTKIANTKYIYDALATFTGLIPERGQCQLVKNGSNLQLNPHNGNLLIIAGAAQAIPDAGITLAATGLTVGTLHYIYAYMNAGNMTLEASTTAYAVSTTAGNKGVRIKSGDNTRTLVGMARPITGPAWQDAEAQRYVRSWFNEDGIEAQGPSISARQSTASATLTELSTSFRCEFLTWAGERIETEVIANPFNSTVNAGCLTAGAIDGTVVGQTAYINSVGSAVFTAFAKGYKNPMTEGYHYGTIFQSCSAGTLSNLGDVDAAGCSPRMWVRTRRY